MNAATKRQACVLLTSQFPVRAEDFLWYELPFLSREFSQVLILSSRGDKRQTADKIKDYQERLEGFGNVSYLGSVGHLIGRFSMPSAAILTEYFRELPKSGLRLKSIAKNAYRFFFAHRIAYKLRTQFPDSGEFVFYSYWLNVSAIALATLTYKKNLLVCRAHGSDIYNDNLKSGFNGLQRYSATHLDRIFCISKHGKRYLEDTTGISATQFEVARLGVPRQDTAHQPVYDDARPMSLVSCSAIDQNKNLDLLLDALALIGNQKVTWLHIGDGNDADRIRQKALGLPSNCSAEFVGHISQAEIAEIYRARLFDLFINTSKSEGVPVAAMEAMSFGIPCVASNVGGTSELVGSGVGEVFNIDVSPKTLARLIVEATERRRKHWRATGLDAQQRVKNCFDAETNGEAFARRLSAMGIEKCEGA